MSRVPRGGALALPAAVVALCGAVAAPAGGDVVVADDLVVQGAACVGTDCVDGEAFGTDVVRLKENNTRLRFEDTSTGGAPTNDWELTANDTGSGGMSYFGVLDVTGARQTLRVRAGAPTDALTLAAGGVVSLPQGPLLAAIDGTTTENPSPVDGAALLTALAALPISTYHGTGDPSAARHAGPPAAAFNAAFGVGGGGDVAPADLAGGALAVMKEVAARVASATTAARGPQGAEGATGATGPAGPPGADGGAPSTSQVDAFTRRLRRLASSQRTLVRRSGSLAKRIDRLRAASR
jgi:hypothetical protein